MPQAGLPAHITFHDLRHAFASRAAHRGVPVNVLSEVLALDLPERELIIRALDDPPAGLEELRAVLLQEQVWWVREGL